MRGRIPNREDDLARPRSRRGGQQRKVTKGKSQAVTWPRMPSDWHPIAKMIWQSIKESGQADFYQQSDVAFAYMTCDELSEYKKADWRKASMLEALLSGLSRLMVTEADRRQARIELQAPEPEATPASVLAIADYKRDLEVTDGE